MIFHFNLPKEIIIFCELQLYSLDHFNMAAVGFYMSAKKWQKLNTDYMKQLLADRQILMVKLDLDSDLESQGPLAAIVHKLSEDAVKAKLGDLKSLQRLQAFEVSRFRQSMSSFPHVNSVT